MPPPKKQTSRKGTALCVQRSRQLRDHHPNQPKNTSSLPTLNATQANFQHAYEVWQHLCQIQCRGISVLFSARYVNGGGVLRDTGMGQNAPYALGITAEPIDNPLEFMPVVETPHQPEPMEFMAIPENCPTGLPLLIVLSCSMPPSTLCYPCLFPPL
jgi:hypothetical protein